MAIKKGQLDIMAYNFDLTLYFKRKLKYILTKQCQSVCQNMTKTLLAKCTFLTI